jgi:acetylornithine deacetylase/succinyl-diaminopimelate desuccinylase-like protein
VFIASDGPRIHPDKPTIFMGSRGVFNFTMRLESHAGGHHSGNWGGLLTNPGVVMAHALASMIDRNGKILVEGWRNTHIPNSVRTAIAKLEVGGGDNAPKINPNWGEPDMTLAERVFASNTFEVRAFETGNPQSPANAIPPSAVVFGHLRYVVGTEVSQLMPLLRAHLDKHGFGDITITSERDPMYATRLDPDHPWAKWAVESLWQTAGEEISVVPNLGGSLPNDVFADLLGLPTIWVPHSYAGCSQHAPNEHILESVTQSALRLMTGLWWDLGTGNTPKDLA